MMPSFNAAGVTTASLGTAGVANVASSGFATTSLVAAAAGLAATDEVAAALGFAAAKPTAPLLDMIRGAGGTSGDGGDAGDNTAGLLTAHDSSIAAKGNRSKCRYFNG